MPGAATPVNLGAAKFCIVVIISSLTPPLCYIPCLLPLQAEMIRCLVFVLNFGIASQICSVEWRERAAWFHISAVEVALFRHLSRAVLILIRSCEARGQIMHTWCLFIQPATRAPLRQQHFYVVQITSLAYRHHISFRCFEELGISHHSVFKPLANTLTCHLEKIVTLAQKQHNSAHPYAQKIASYKTFLIKCSLFSNRLLRRLNFKPFHHVSHTQKH